MRTVERFETFANDIRHDVTTAGRNLWLAGLGAVSAVETRARGTFDQLVDKGKNREKDLKKTGEKVVGSGQEQIDRIKDLSLRVGDGVEERMQSVIHRMGVPTGSEVRTLTERVEALNKKLDEMKKA